MIAYHVTYYNILLTTVQGSCYLPTVVVPQFEALLGSLALPLSYGLRWYHNTTLHIIYCPHQLHHQLSNQEHRINEYFQPCWFLVFNWLNGGERRSPFHWAVKRFNLYWMYVIQQYIEIKKYSDYMHIIERSTLCSFVNLLNFHFTPFFTAFHDYPSHSVLIMHYITINSSYLPLIFFWVWYFWVLGNIWFPDFILKSLTFFSSSYLSPVMV